MENNPNKKTKEENIQRLLIEAMATHDTLTKNFIESNLEKKTTLPSQIHMILDQNVMNDSYVHILCSLQFIYEMFNLGIHVYE
jgi:hypothetical protein